MNCGLTTRLLASVQLRESCHFLDFWANNTKDCLCYYAADGLPNTHWVYSWAIHATSMQAVRGASPAGSIVVVQICLANSATELHRSEEAFLKEVHKRLHPCESSPDGPAPPWDLRAAIQILSPSNCSNNTGCGIWTGEDWRRVSGWAGWPVGCFWMRISQTDCYGAAWAPLDGTVLLRGKPHSCPACPIPAMLL